MTFEELDLCLAIEAAGRCPDTPKTHRERIDLVVRVYREWIDIHGDSIFPFSIDDVVRWDTNLRKNKDTRTKVDVAKQHGKRCFWVGRGKGDCSQDVDCGHLVPNVSGGPLSVPNCVIECSFHNRSRGVMSIEEYLRSELGGVANGVA